MFGIDIFNSNLGFHFLVFFALVNLLSFLVMMLDKQRSSRYQTQRISEGMMFFLATVMGSLGIYAGMFAFRHKTQKWYFLIGIPLLLIENLASLYILYLFLETGY